MVVIFYCLYHRRRIGFSMFGFFGYPVMLGWSWEQTTSSLTLCNDNVCIYSRTRTRCRSTIYVFIYRGGARFVDLRVFMYKKKLSRRRSWTFSPNLGAELTYYCQNARVAGFKYDNNRANIPRYSGRCFPDIWSTYPSCSAYNSASPRGKIRVSYFLTAFSQWPRYTWKRGRNGHRPSMYIIPCWIRYNCL